MPACLPPSLQGTGAPGIFGKYLLPGYDLELTFLPSRVRCTVWPGLFRLLTALLHNNVPTFLSNGLSQPYPIPGALRVWLLDIHLLNTCLQILPIIYLLFSTTTLCLNHGQHSLIQCECFPYQNICLYSVSLDFLH